MAPVHHGRQFLLLLLHKLLLLMVHRSDVLLRRQTQLAGMQERDGLLFAGCTVVVMMQVPVARVMVRVMMMVVVRVRRLDVVLCVVHYMVLVLQTVVVVLFRARPVQTLLAGALNRAHLLLLVVLEALLAPQVAAVLEHVARVRVQRPE